MMTSTAPPDVLILVAAGLLLVAGSGVLQFVMVKRVNRHLPHDQRVPSSARLTGGDNEKSLRIEFRRLFPHSHLGRASAILGTLGFLVLVLASVYRASQIR